MTKKALVPFQAVAFIPTGLTGATSASRYVGATATGAPTTGTFVAGDWVVTLDGHIFICTTGGSPGTWVNAGASVSPATTVTSETTYGIAAAVGTSLLYARQDHTHGTPTTPVTSVAAGAGISVSGATGAVTITNTGALLTANTFSATQTFQSANVSTAYDGTNIAGVGSFANPTLIFTPNQSATATNLVIEPFITFGMNYWTGAATAAAQAHIKGSVTSATGATALIYDANTHFFDGIVLIGNSASLTSGGLITANAGITVPSGQALTTGTRSVVTGARTTTTNASDTVDLGTFSSTGGAVELRIHSHLVASTTSVTKVYEVAAGATMGFLATVTAMTNVGTTVTATVASTTGLTSGQAVTIAGAAGLTNVNGTWTVTVTSATQFTFVVTTTPSGTYTASSATASAWYLCVPADTSQNAAATNDFALETRRSATGTFIFRFRQKSIAAAGAITFTVETLGDSVVTFTPSTTVTAAPVAVSILHPSNSFAAAAGRVGIGTDSPAGLLHLLGIDPTAVVSIVQGASGQTGNLEEWRDFSGNGVIRFASDGAVALGGSNGKPASVRLQSVGLGSTTIAAGSSPTSTRRNLITNSNIALDEGGLSASPWSYWMQISDVTATATYYPLILQPNGGTVGIGLGSTSPGANLHVVSSGTGAVAFMAFGVSGQTVDIADFGPSAGKTAYIDNTGMFHFLGVAGAATGTHFVNNANNADLHFGNTADGVDYVVVATAGSSFQASSDGAVPIIVSQHSGTQSGGLTKWTNFNTSVVIAQVTAAGNVQGTGAYTTLSDAAVKKNVRALVHDPLDVIRRLRPVHFDYRGGETDQVGFIAQDTQKALPQAVVPWDGDQRDLSGQRSEAILAYVVAALQELDRRTAVRA